MAIISVYRVCGVEPGVRASYRAVWWIPSIYRLAIIVNTQVRVKDLNPTFGYS
jgi:hypothetical protein